MCAIDILAGRQECLGLAQSIWRNVQDSNSGLAVDVSDKSCKRHSGIRRRRPTKQDRRGLSRKWVRPAEGANVPGSCAVKHAQLGLAEKMRVPVLEALVVFPCTKNIAGFLRHATLSFKQEEVEWEQPSHASLADVSVPVPPILRARWYPQPLPLYAQESSSTPASSDFPSFTRCPCVSDPI